MARGTRGDLAKPVVGLGELLSQHLGFEEARSAGYKEATESPVR